VDPADDDELQERMNAIENLGFTLTEQELETPSEKQVEMFDELLEYVHGKYGPAVADEYRELRSSLLR
jgi:hypothetical protein